MGNNSKLLSIKNNYSNRWLAIDPNSESILASEVSLKKLALKMERLNKDYIIERVIPKELAFIPISR